MEILQSISDYSYQINHPVNRRTFLSYIKPLQFSFHYSFQYFIILIMLFTLWTVIAVLIQDSFKHYVEVPSWSNKFSQQSLSTKILLYGILYMKSLHLVVFKPLKKIFLSCHGELPSFVCFNFTYYIIRIWPYIIIFVVLFCSLIFV